MTEACCREERLQFYHLHNVAFVARPPHGKGGYLRHGRFKKASNMNYCLDISRQVETLMQASPLMPVSMESLLTLKSLARHLYFRKGCPEELSNVQQCLHISRQVDGLG